MLSGSILSQQVLSPVSEPNLPHLTSCNEKPLLLMPFNIAFYRIRDPDMNTLMGIKGRDFVLLGGDSAFFRSVVIMDAVSAEHRSEVLADANLDRQTDYSRTLVFLVVLYARFALERSLDYCTRSRG